MKLSMPSPAMGVALVALFVSLGGTSIAAVNYARSAGEVDGKSAYGSSSSLDRVAGNLVATQRSGPGKGKLAAKFLHGVPQTQTFGRAFDVTDNAQNAAVPIGGAAEVGSISASCVDENARPGIEDPATTLTLTNASGEGINVARQVGNGANQVSGQPNGTAASLTIRGSNTFSYHVERRGVNLLIQGVVRQDGRGSATASCLVYGTVLRVES